MTSDPDHTVDADSTVEGVVVEATDTSEVVGDDDELDEETRRQLDEDGTLMDTREVVDSLLENE